VELHNQDVISLIHTARVPSHKDIKLRDEVARAEDIFTYLLDVPYASVEEIGLNLKIVEPELITGLEKLEKAGYIKIRHVDTVGLDVERKRRTRMTPEAREREDSIQDSMWEHKHPQVESTKIVNIHATLEKCSDEGEDDDD
jgi:hypothetical protein